MQESFDQYEFEEQKPLSVPIKPRFFETILKRLTGLKLMTETELQEAGINIGYQQDDEKHN